MKERPILFSGPMVRALLAGRKPQTRRLLSSRLQDTIEFFDVEASDFAEVHFEREGHSGPGWYVHCSEYPEEGAEFLGPCPHGVPGDRLWVKETWYCDDHSAGDHRSACTGCVDCKHTDADRIAQWRQELFYRADGEPYFGNTEGVGYWRPSIHMWRWASRITLDLTSVRVERLQDISREDAIAEGLESHDDDGVTYWGPLGQGHYDPVAGYRILWESINGEGSWAANPWVWVLGFKRISE